MPAEAPIDFDQLCILLAQKVPGLSPQLARAATLIEPNVEDFALLPLRELASRFGLPIATFSRLARALDFDSFAALRRVCANQLRQPGGFSQRVGLLGTPGNGTPSDSERIGSSLLGHLQSMFTRCGDDELDAAARLLHSARRIHPFAARSGVALAHTFCYIAQLFDDRIVPIYGIGDTLNDGLRHVGPEDVVLAMTFDPYTRPVVEGLYCAHERGARIIYLTDSPLAPGHELADVLLVAPVEIPSFFHSFAAPMAMLDALLLRWYRLAGVEAFNRLATSDAQLKRARAFVRVAPPRGGRLEHKHADEAGD